MHHVCSWKTVGNIQIVVCHPGFQTIKLKHEQCRICIRVCCTIQSALRADRSDTQAAQCLPQNSKSLETDLWNVSVWGVKVDPKWTTKARGQNSMSKPFSKQQAEEMNRCENPLLVKRAQEDIWSWLHYSLTAGCLLAALCLCFINPLRCAVSVHPMLFSASPWRFSFTFCLSFHWHPGAQLIPQCCMQHCTVSCSFNT